MYLKKLELYGFKSFADRTTLEFMPGITSVIGPNGSGKSNISDAIRWVLGEQSMKSLRGAKSEDVIFAGTQNRKSLGFAECSLVLDNSDGALPIEYTEVTVTRRIYRNGETGYLINKTPCRLKDILELFMDTGIGKDGYSIIGQGKIDEILSNKSEDRRHIFEEAAGIVKYRVRKGETEKKLEQTKLNLLRVNDILSEIEGKIEPLKGQSEKAKQFLTLREELKNIEIGLFLYHIDHYKEKIEEIVNDTKEFEQDLKQEEIKQEQIQQLKEKLKEEIDTLDHNIEDLQRLNFESTNKIEQLNSKQNMAKQKIEIGNENKIRFESEIQELNKRISELEEEKQQKSEKKVGLFTNKDKFEKELKDKERELEEISNKLSSKEKELEEKKQTVQTNTDLKYEKKNQMSSKLTNIENLKKRAKELDEEFSSTISELDGNRMKKNEIGNEFYQMESKKEEIKKAIEEMTSKKKESDEKTKRYDSKINELWSQVRMKESRLRFLNETEKEKEGYQKSVKALLIDCKKDESLAQGMCGALADLIRVPKEYEIAIEMCLGGALQNLVTKTEEDAKKLVEHLRINNLGRASFLPISSVKGKKLDKLIQNGLPGIIGIASDLISYDSKYEQIIYNLLGKTVIVDHMDTAVILARQNHYAFRIVTLKGDVINSSGSITGGSVQTKTVNILGRKQEIEDLEKEVKKQKEEMIQIEAEKEEYIDQIETLLEEASSLERQMADTEISYVTQKQKIVLLEENIQKLEAKRDHLKEEKDQNQTAQKNDQAIYESLEREIELLEGESSQLNEVITQYAVKHKEEQKYIDDLNFDITNLKISVSSFEESENAIDEMVQRIEQEIGNNRKAVDEKQDFLTKIAQEQKLLEIQIQQTKQEIEETAKLATNSVEEVEQLKLVKVQKRESQTTQENLWQKQLEILTQLKDQIGKQEIKKSKLEVELEQVINKMWEDYEMTPNQTEGYQRPENVSSTTKQVNELRNQIKNLGSINIDSIEEYKQTKQRYDFLCEQRLDLENATAKLRKMITEMTDTMKEQFKEQFYKINQNFGEVFVELFGGGKAELKLTDPDNILECGIEIEVQPPGKKLQNMMLLSGGEKAFTAIALLFAILKLNPAPFCVLDEIEAALDDVNVYRFAEYLKKFVLNTQFLVITHRKGTMEAADTVYGITMEENGISKLLSIKLK